jgi:hypothetical protein
MPPNVTTGFEPPRTQTVGKDGANVVQLSPPALGSESVSVPASKAYSASEPWPWPAPTAPLKPEPWQSLGLYDPARSGLEPLPLRRKDGKALRERVPHQTHAFWAPAPNRPDPVAVLMKTNEDRQQDLVPIRMARMAASPFGFLRGACAVMAWDLAHTQVTGLTVIMDGDAHHRIIIGHLNGSDFPRNLGHFSLPRRRPAHVRSWG